MITVIIKGILFTSMLIYAAISDIKKREIDNWISVSILIISLIGSGGSFLGGTLTAVPFFIPAILKNGSVGGGDIKIMFACGALLGVWGGMLQTIISLILVVIFSIGILIKKGFNNYNKTTLPLAPFLCVGGVISYIIVNFN